MTTPPPPDSLSADLRRLEEIVRQLEADDTDLDRALVLFEEGVARLRAARDRLTEAEARVQKVLEDAAGQLTVTGPPPTSSSTFRARPARGFCWCPSRWRSSPRPWATSASPPRTSAGWRRSSSKPAASAGWWAANGSISRRKAARSTCPS